MTDAAHPQDHHAEVHDASHEGPIKTPKQLLLALIWAHVLPIGIVLLLVAFVAAHIRPSAGSNALTAASIESRIQPVGHVEVREVAEAASAAPASAMSAEQGGTDAAAAALASAKAAMANVASAKTTAAPAAGANGGAAPALYTQVCQACHATGAAGAPKFGDKAAWAPRLKDGIDGMTAIAIHGKGAMPPRGGTTASDAEIKAVVTYMANAAK